MDFFIKQIIGIVIIGICFAITLLYLLPVTIKDVIDIIKSEEFFRNLMLRIATKLNKGATFCKRLCERGRKQNENKFESISH